MGRYNPLQTEYFDDDEENPPIGFEQDPDEDEIGVGTWKYADGSTKYSKGDTDDAKRLMKAAPPAPEKGLGSGGPYAPRAQLPEASPLTDEEKAPLEASPGELDALGGSAAPASPGTASPVAKGEPMAPEASEQPKPFQALTAPQMPGARGPARYTDSVGQTDSQSQSQSDQQSVTRTGSAQDRGEFEQGQSDITKAYEKQGQAIDEGAQGVAGAIQQRRQQIAQMAADKEAATAGAIASNEARKQQVIKKYQEVDSRKTDMNGLWKDKGALGTTLGLLGVALRSITATKFGGPNTALQSIQEQKRQNLQAQMEDRNSELRGLERELGSIEAAAPMLEARMNDALSKRLEAMTLDEKSATVLANAKQMKNQLDTESALKKAESAKAYAGTLAQQQTQQSSLARQQGTSQERQRLSGAGVGGEAQGKTREQMYDDLLERDKKMEERGIPKEERAKMWAEYGFGAPSGESAPEMTNREQREKVAREEETLNEDQAKAESGMKLLDEYGQAAGLKRDPKTGRWIEPGVLAGTIKPGWSEGIKEVAGQATPVRDRRTAATQGIGRFLSGSVIGEDEAIEIAGLIGDENATRNQLASRLNAAEDLVNERRKAKFKNKPRSAPESWKSKKPEASP